MNWNKFALSAVAASLLISFTGCGDEDSNNNNTGSAASTPGVTGDGRETVYSVLEADNASTTGVTLNASTAAPSTELSWADSVALPTLDTANIVVVTANITTDTTWDATKQYKLDGEIKVSNNATLTIPAGTVVFGDAGANYMVVLKGSKLQAEGTAANPITFTSLAQLTDGTRGQGNWGGLTILGDATTNHTAPVYEVDEDDTDFAFGGTTDTDDSGTLKYVRILDSGYTVATDLEINGLSLCGVGSGTSIDNIYVENSSDDGIEIWGGTVDLSNIEIVNAGDDSFDLDYGYTGNVENLTVTQVDPAHAGMEISSGGESPLTSPTIKNFTVTVVDASDEGGIYLKDDTTAPTFLNGKIVMNGTNSHGAIRAKKVPVAAAKKALKFGDITVSEGTNDLVDGDGAHFVKGALYANATELTWADEVALPTLAAAADIVEVTANITTDTTWDATKQYKLVGEIKVSNNATLTIPAGTVVFGDAGANYMVVLKGSKLIAQGTEANPITFTSLAQLTDGTRAQGNWGGLTILGDATTNHTAPVYEVDEDDTDFAFGGTTDADNSGTLTYVRILDSGYTVATDLEINGLSLCGVGSGTTIDNIYVENSSDDGIEIWGGTVDLSNIEIVNAGDDSFDLDYGYTGNVNNLTVTQTSTAHAGMEISSGGDTPLTSPTISNFRVTTYTDSDEGGIYFKDDTTAPTFVNGLVHHTGDTTHGAIRAKKEPTTEAANALAFKNVILDPAE